MSIHLRSIPLRGIAVKARRRPPPRAGRAGSRRPRSRRGTLTPIACAQPASATVRKPTPATRNARGEPRGRARRRRRRRAAPARRSTRSASVAEPAAEREPEEQRERREEDRRRRPAPRRSTATSVSCGAAAWRTVSPCRKSGFWASAQPAIDRRDGERRACSAPARSAAARRARASRRRRRPRRRAPAGRRPCDEPVKSAVGVVVQHDEPGERDARRRRRRRRARARGSARASSVAPCRTASAHRKPRPGTRRRARRGARSRIEVGFSQLVTRSPRGVADGHAAARRCPPIAVPSANGVRIDEIENSVSIAPLLAPRRCVRRAARRRRRGETIPIPAMKSGIASVEAIEPNAERVRRPDDGEDEDQPDVVRLPHGRHRVVGVRRGSPRPLAAAAVSCQKPAPKSAPAEHRVEREPDEREDERQRRRGASVLAPASAAAARRERARRIHATPDRERRRRRRRASRSRPGCRPRR